MLVPEAHHSFSEEFEPLMYDFPLPVLLEKWLHVGTSATPWKLRPCQTFSANSADSTWTGLPSKREGKLLCYRKKQSSHLKGSACVVLLFESYMILGKSLRFSEAQVAHL